MTTRRSPSEPDSRSVSWQSSAFRGAMQGRVRSARLSATEKQGAIQKGASGASGIKVSGINLIRSDSPPAELSLSTLWVDSKAMLWWYDPDQSAWVRAMSGVPYADEDVHNNNIIYGPVTSVYGRDSVVIGDGAESGKVTDLATTTIGAVAIGYEAKANGRYSIAIGGTAEAFGDESIALGSHSLAQDDYSVAAGAYAVAVGEKSVAIGYTAQTGGDNQVWIGTAENVTPPATAGYGRITSALLRVSGPTASKETSLVIQDTSGVRWRLYIDTSGVLQVVAY